MFSCRMFTVLGMLVIGKLALLTLFESWNYSRACRGRCNLLGIIVYVPIEMIILQFWEGGSRSERVRSDNPSSN